MAWASLARATAGILGARILGLLLVSALLYSTASAYVEASLSGLATFYREGLRPPQGLGLVSLYSGVASTPLSGILPPSLLERALETPGVVGAWGETAVPALAGGHPVTVRGLPWSVARGMLKIVRGSMPGEGDCRGALVGSGAAPLLGVGPGSLVVVEPLFSRGEAVLVVRGVFEGPEPYRDEVIVCPALAQALRGHRGYTVVRILYNPQRLAPRELAERLGLHLGPEPSRALAQEVVLLVARGQVRGINPAGLSSYYEEHLGVPRGLIAALAIAADTLLALLMASLAWAVVASRRASLRAMVEQGLSPRGVKGLLLAVTLPAAAAGAALGALASGLLPPGRILGYQLPTTPRGALLGIHIVVFSLVYAAGVATADVEA